MALTGTFTDNPLIASLSNAVGLGDLLGTSPPAVSQAPKMASAQNRPEYQEARPYLPRNMMQPGQGGGSPSMPNVPGGVMSLDTLQSPTVHDLLATYGVSAPQGIDQHMFIHDPEAFAKHPLIAGMLENGLQGAAYAQPGQNFFQSLIGGVRGMQDARAANIANMNAQTMAPINQAMSIAQLQNMKSANDREQAQQDYNESRAKYYDDLYSNKDQLQSERQDFQTRLQGMKDQLTAAGQDPTKVLQNQIIAQGKKELADKQYGGDQTKLTSTDLQNIYKGLMGNTAQASVSKSAGARSVKQTQGAGTRGANTPKLSAGDRLAVQQIDNESQQINSNLKALDANGGMGTDENGNPIITEQDENGYRQRMTSRLRDLQTQRGGIAAKYGSPAQTPASAPAPSRNYSPNNPFAPK